MYLTQKKNLKTEYLLESSSVWDACPVHVQSQFPHPEDEKVWYEICSETEWTQSLIKTGRCPTQKRKKTKEVKLALCHYEQKPPEEKKKST